jgi:hypothetical protein
MGVILIVLFAAAQGAAVFGTAFLALRLIGTSHWFAKAVAMALSCVAWITFTIVTYTLLGGEGGLMDGFGMVLVLCFTAMISSFFYLILWTLAGFAKGAH